MKRLCFALILLWPVATLAQDVTIRSGDHSGFARLVLAIPEGADWRLGRSLDGYDLSIAGVDGYDATEVFDRIDQSRIAGLTADGALLRVDIACDCHADAFLWRPDRLVLDVIDGAPPEGSPFERALESPVRPRRRPEPLEEFEPIEPRIPLPSPRPEEAARVAGIETSLLESLARAASQGVVEFSPAPEPLTLDAPGAGPVPGLRVQTSVDRDARRAAPHGDAPAATSCPDPLDWDMTVWAGTNFDATIAARRAALTGEFDAWTPGAVEDLARAFIAYGFGAEARQALDLDDIQSSERLMLRDMALLVDGETPPAETALARLGGCDAPVALWSVLASDAGVADPGAVLRSYKAMPDPLRRAIGPRLAHQFTEMEESVLADAVLSDLGGGASVARAELGLSRGETETALDMLDDMARTDPRFGPLDLARLIDLSLDEGREIDPGLLTLAEALQFEHSGTDAAAVLAAARFRAALAADRFDEAAALLAEPPLADGPGTGAMAEDLTLALTERGGDLVFLDHVLGGSVAEVAPQTENRIAARLTDLGFAAAARRRLQAEPSGPAAAERRYLRAEIALALGETETVEDLLLALTDARARDLRARARAARGDHGGALAARSDPDPEAAWRAGAWVALEQSDDAILAGAARIMQRPGPRPLSDDSLSARQALLEEASQSRAEIDALLTRFAPPDMPGG